MGFLAAAIPIAMSVLGAMGEEEEKVPAGPAVPPPPGLGEIFAMTGDNGPSQFQDQYSTPPGAQFPVGGERSGS